MLRPIAPAFVPAFALAFALLAAAPALAQQQSPAPKPASIEDAAATETYLERRWLLLQIRTLLQKIPAGTTQQSLDADAQRLGTRGPSMAEVALLDMDLAAETAAYLAMVENRIRSGQAKWPADKPAMRHANEALVELELIRLELKETRARKRDEWPAMARAGRIFARSTGQSPAAGSEAFDGRDAMVERAMRKIRLPIPQPRR